MILAADANPARPVGQRITWLQERARVHRFGCNHHQVQRSRWHCLALAWTRRELHEAQQESWRRIETGDWTVATLLADRVYPGTRSWLLSCSSGEGGHGRFVWNTVGSGSGGWMQFLHSTYDSYVSAARAETSRRGFIVRPARWSYFQPLGQALTAAYMRSHGMSYHWDPGIDPLCA